MMKKVLELLGFSGGCALSIFAESSGSLTFQPAQGSVEYPIVPFSQYIEYYLRDPVIMSAADYMEQAIAGMGATRQQMMLTQRRS